MTELQLYKYITDKCIETHIYKNGAEKLDLSELTDDNYWEWKVYMFPYIWQLQDFIDMCSATLFDDEGLECVLKQDYICIDLLPIMGHYGIEPTNIFPKNN